MKMRETWNMIIMIGLITAVGAGLFGCGSGNDLLDEENQRYTATMAINEIAGDNDTLQVDAVQDTCDDGDPEDFSDTLGVIKIIVESGAPGLTLDEYSIDYRAIGSPNGSGEIELPPDLVNPPNGHAAVTVASGGSTTFTITLMSMDTKEEFAIDMGWLYYSYDDLNGDLEPDGWGYWGWYYYLSPEDLAVARYEISVTLYFTDENQEKREITVFRTVYLSNYNNC